MTDILRYGKLGITNEEGKLTEKGRLLLGQLLTKVKPIWQGDDWTGFFEELLTRVVATAVEVILVRDGRALLTYRDETYDRVHIGWHFPGTYVSPGESLIDAARRCLKRETELSCFYDPRTKEGHPIGVVNHAGSPRFHDLSLLILVKSDDRVEESDTTRWFTSPPDDLIDAHKSYWSFVEPYLRSP